LAWTVNFEPRALGELKKLGRIAQNRVIAFFQARVSGEGNPRLQGKPLVGDKVGLWRYRIGSYRVVCRIEDESQTVLVLRVAHRKDVYR
jgi:mRNA interferase RelE/StbE